MYRAYQQSWSCLPQVIVQATGNALTKAVTAAEALTTVGRRLNWKEPPQVRFYPGKHSSHVGFTRTIYLLRI